MTPPAPDPARDPAALLVHLQIFLKEAPAVDELRVLLPTPLLLPDPSGCPQAPPAISSAARPSASWDRQSHFYAPSPLEIGTTVIPTLEMRTWRLRDLA